VSANEIIVLAKRCHTNPQGGFPTFQINVQMIDVPAAKSQFDLHVQMYERCLGGIMDVPCA